MGIHIYSMKMADTQLAGTIMMKDIIISMKKVICWLVGRLSMEKGIISIVVVSLPKAG